MWVWGTIFGLGRDLSRYAMRGVGCVFALGFLVALLGGLGTSLFTHNQDEAAALAVGATSIDADASLRDNAWLAAQGYRTARERRYDSDLRPQPRGEVAADWDRDRREQEADEAARDAYAYEY